MVIGSVFWQIPLKGEDIGFVEECFLKKNYEKIDGFESTEGAICLDIGANIGAVSIRWQQTNRTGKIFSIEPHPETYCRLVTNINLNKINNIIPINAAVGASNGLSTFYIRPCHSMATSFRLDNSKPITVQMTTIDSIVQQYDLELIDLCKIDVEGNELPCLEGAKNTLPHIRKMVLEFHDQKLREEVIKTLEPYFWIHSVDNSQNIGLVFAESKR
jgi:FkbM family methyltransferase